MAIRKDKGQDCYEIYVPLNDIQGEQKEFPNLSPTSDNEIRVCDVEEDGQIHWYIDESIIESVLLEEDLKEIIDLSESLIY